MQYIISFYQINLMEQPMQNKSMLPGAIIIAGTLIAISIIFKSSSSKGQADIQATKVHVQATISDGGHILPLGTEKNMLDKLTKDGVIDGSKLPQVTELNLLWAFGLADKNRILESGTISDLRYGGPMNMASVGGWSVSDGSPSDHMSKHGYVTLTLEQQSLVEKVSKGIYRPCCNNSTYFPDCNHCMAMLGLLEYLAAQEATEDQIWSAALTANTIWFPDAYQTIAQYMEEKGIDGKTVSPQEILSADYSSASGFAKISAQVTPLPNPKGSNGCGVDARQSIDASKQPSCGV